MNWTNLLRRGAITAVVLATASITGACAKNQNSAELKDNSNGYTERRGSAREGQDIAVGAFNLLRLGQGEKNMQRMASVIDKAKYDIFAATEIMKPEGAEELLEALRTETGHDWRMTLSAVPNGEGSYKEYNGFYYRAEAVKAELPSSAFCKTREGVDRIESSCFARDNGGEYIDFERDPFVGHFKIHGVSVSLISVHLIYGDSIERRQGEAETLREVMDDVHQKTPGSIVLTLGDFNLTVANYSEIPSNPSARDIREAIPEPVFTKGSNVSGLIDGPTTLGFSSYDHILLYSDLKSSLIPQSAKIVHDLRDISDADARALFKAEVSDHYAITARFKIH